MWDLPRPGIKLTPPTLAGGFFSTEPPGKPQICPSFLSPDHVPNLAQKPLWPPELLHPPLLLRLVFSAHHGPPPAGLAMSCLFPCSHTHTHTHTHTHQTESSLDLGITVLCSHCAPCPEWLPKASNPHVPRSYSTASSSPDPTHLHELEVTLWHLSSCRASGSGSSPTCHCRRCMVYTSGPGLSRPSVNVMD